MYIEHLKLRSEHPASSFSSSSSLCLHPFSSLLLLSSFSTTRNSAFSDQNFSDDLKIVANK